MVQETHGGRSIVPLAPGIQCTPPARHHLAQSTFMAQLLATRLDAPVSRRLRRASPAAAITCYQIAAALGTTRTVI